MRTPRLGLPPLPGIRGPPLADRKVQLQGGGRHVQVGTLNSGEVRAGTLLLDEGRLGPLALPLAQPPSGRCLRRNQPRVGVFGLLRLYSRGREEPLLG